MATSRPGNPPAEQGEGPPSDTLVSTRLRPQRDPHHACSERCSSVGVCLGERHKTRVGDVGCIFVEEFSTIG